MGNVLRHTLVVAILSGVVQLAGAAFIAWKLSERWQRWRQRRDFQHRTMAKFAEVSLQLAGDFSSLGVDRPHVPGDVSLKDFRALGRLTADHGAQLLSLEYQIRGLFRGDRDAIYMEVVPLRDLITEIQRMAFASPQTYDGDLARRLRVQFTKRCDIVLTMMLGEMKLISDLEKQQWLASLEEQVP